MIQPRLLDTTLQCCNQKWRFEYVCCQIINISREPSFMPCPFKVYIPLRHKTICIWYWHWLGPQTPHFCITYTNMLVSFALGDANFSRHLTQNPQRESFAFGSQREPHFQWNMGFNQTRVAPPFTCNSDRPSM